MIALLVIVLIPISFVSAENNKASIYFFWGDGCPHCEHEKDFLSTLKQSYPNIEINEFETWNNKDNAKLMADVAKAYETQVRGVPMTFIDNTIH